MLLVLVKNKIGVHINVKLILFTLLISIFIISLNNSSYAVKIIEEKRNSNMIIAANNEAYIGIDNRESYSVKPGDKLTIIIKNNLPNIVNYDVEMLAPYITKIEPNQFILGVNGECRQVTVYISEDAIKGSYDTKGVIHAKWDSGSSDISISFKTNIINK